MRIVVQRVSGARVSVEGRRVGEIGPGAVVLVGIGGSDTPDVADRMADKLVDLRYFRDDEGRTNLAIGDAGGSLLVVSQFTLYADVRHGRRPGFADAAAPEMAEGMVARFCDRLRARGITVEIGEFGASMLVELANDGPFTLVLDSERDLG